MCSLFIAVYIYKFYRNPGNLGILLNYPQHIFFNTRVPEMINSNIPNEVIRPPKIHWSITYYYNRSAYALFYCRENHDSIRFRYIRKRSVLSFFHLVSNLFSRGVDFCMCAWASFTLHVSELIVRTVIKVLLHETPQLFLHRENLVLTMERDSCSVRLL